ncbi:MAG: transporter [Saprospiraceae bacterium]|nr:transporter [Saprospiraceae bacterium]
MAQTPTDAIMMDRNQMCNALLATDSRWSEYWEGELRRSNQNIGTNVTQSLMYMANYGITKKWNVMAGLPYIRTHNTAGHLADQRGIQDLSLWVKYRPLEKRAGPGLLSVFGTLGFSTPVGGYIPDLQPMAIGMGCSTFSGRLIADYHLDGGWYSTIQGGYWYRTNTETDRDAYQINGEIIYSSEVRMPNMADFSINAGYRKGLWNFALNYNQLVCVDGDDIRRNDMPFPTNKMDATSVGLMAKFHAEHLGFVLNANQIFAGRNMGRATTFQAGLLYALYLKKRG